MTDYTELVKALRCYELGLHCNECKYAGWSDSGKECNCEWARMQHDAAAAIEELLESVGMLGEQRSYWIDKAAEYYNQLPKRGEWMDVTDSYFWYGRCSVCGAELNVDGWYAELMNYCPKCGAKMEVQDG